MISRSAAGRPRLPLGAPAGVLAAAIVLASCSGAPSHCRAEVAAAFERLRTSGQPYRKETAIAVADWQAYRQVAEFIPPDRMHEVTINRTSETTAHGIRFPAHEITSELVRIGARAWAKEGQGWREWEAGLAQELYGAGMDFLLLPDRVLPANAAFACLGLVEFKGTTYIGYRTQLDKSIAYMALTNPKERAELEAKVQQELREMPQEWRTVFIDKSSGRPVYDLIAAENQLERPRYQVHFTYPGDMRIDPPMR